MILDTLEEYGQIPDDLRNRIYRETDIDRSCIFVCGFLWIIEKLYACFYRRKFSDRRSQGVA